MKKLLQLLYNFGIHQDQNPTHIERQKNINLICWTTILSCLFMLLVNIPTGEKIRIYALIVVTISFFIPPIFNYYKKTEAAKFSLLVIAHLVIFIYGLLYGDALGIEYFFLITPVAALLLTNEKNFHYFLLISSTIAFAGLKVSYLYLSPFLDIPPQLHVPMILGLTILIIGFVSANRFKSLMTITNNKKEKALQQLKSTNAVLLKKEQELEATNLELQQEAMMRQGAIQALGESEERYQMLFEHGFEGIMIGNLATRKPVSCNEKLLSFLGMKKEQFLGTDMLAMLAVPSDKKDLVEEQTIKRIQQFKSIGKIQFKTALKSPKKGKVIAEVTAVLLPRPNEHLVIAIFKDITQQIKVQEKILAANEGLKNFAHAASHDLKEPLRMIQSFGQLLERRNKNNLDKNSQEFLGYIIDASSRMNQLIQDLLEYSTTGTNEAPPKMIDLNNILFLVQNNLRLKITESKANITTEKLPVIQAHATMITQLFQNIIANGIKFQPLHQPPQIDITVENKSDSIVLQLADNGIGIAPEYHEQIFGVFKRLHSKSDYSGSGIGLATCRKIVEGYGGKIWVDSVLGAGTKFFISLPKSIVVSYETKPKNEVLVNTPSDRHFVVSN